MKSLNEVYKTRVNRMITEEYGISDKLHNDMIPRFQKQLKNEIKNAELATNYGVDCKRGKFIFNCQDENNTEFKVYWTVYYFKTLNEYNTFMRTHSMMNNVMIEYKILNVTIAYVNGKPVNNGFYDNIGHEFEHLYQEVKMGKGFGNRYVYSVAMSNMYSNNIYDAILARIIYATTKSEQEAMINGFFNEFKNGNVDVNNFDHEIENAECGLWLMNLYDGYVFLKEHKNSPELLKAIYKYKQVKDYYNYKYFLYLTRNGIKSFERRIARLVFKIKQEIYNHSKPTLNENFDVLHNYYLIK